MPESYSLGLIGWPIEHSFSPDIHHAALAAAGLIGKYELYPIPPFPEGRPALEALLDRVRVSQIHGLNVTIPHKQNVIEFLDRLSPAAHAIGAVNTIYLEGIQLIGDNTDAAGFSNHLKAHFNLTSGKALVLGAGGSGRAVAYALHNAGWQVRVAARRIEQAEELSAALNLPQETPLDLTASSLKKAGQNWDLLVNTTPVGMRPDVDSSPFPLEFEDFPGMHVYDLVYNPPETRLVRQAKASGLQAVTGLGMLIEQAALAFIQWTGERASRQAMRASLKV